MAVSSREQVAFAVDPSVVFQLGENLITDEVQALVELVKNAYDADASFCHIAIDTAPVADADAHFPGAVGRIVVEDDGVGMNDSIIRNAWLKISASPKRDLKKAGKNTARGRTPLGDKGLGRLSTQRLADHIEIETRQPDSESEVNVWYSWNDFRGAADLTAVKANRLLRPASRRSGTLLTLWGLSTSPHKYDDVLRAFK